MSTVKAINLQHPSASSPSLVLSSTGNVTGGGLDLITTSTFSAAASVSVNNCFTSAYQHYALLMTYVGSTANVLYWRERLSGVDAATSYAYAGSGMLVNGTSSGFSSSSANQALVGQGATSAYSHLEARILGPAITRATTLVGGIWAVSSGVLYEAFVGASHAVNTAYDGFTFYVDTGTITGELFVYGYRKVA